MDTYADETSMEKVVEIFRKTRRGRPKEFSTTPLHLIVLCTIQNKAHFMTLKIDIAVVRNVDIS